MWSGVLYTERFLLRIFSIPAGLSCRSARTSWCLSQKQRRSQANSALQSHWVLSPAVSSNSPLTALCEMHLSLLPSAAQLLPRLLHFNQGGKVLLSVAYNSGLSDPVRAQWGNFIASQLADWENDGVMGPGFRWLNCLQIMSKFYRLL